MGDAGVNDESRNEGETKIYWRVHDRFWWPEIQYVIRRYVRGCVPCQTRKVLRRLPVGELHPVPNPPFTQ